MSETVNISLMAEKISNDIFKAFGWTKVPPTNHNWKCATPDHQKNTHPSDVVFWYDDPYSFVRVFVTTDLKSYAATTLDTADLASAVSSLAMCVECANIGTAWREFFVRDNENWRCDGLLFIYNHDGEYDKNFHHRIARIDASNFRLPARRRMAILGPSDIGDLVNVAEDISRLRGQKEISLEHQDSSFWFPDLVTVKAREQSTSAATIEMLTGQWITLRLKPEKHQGKLSFFVWYKGTGATVDEFKYLLDWLFRYQMLSVDSEASVRLRLVNPDPLAIPNFNAAKAQYSAALYNLADKRLEKVSCESITRVVTRFSADEIGMEQR